MEENRPTGTLPDETQRRARLDALGRELYPLAEQNQTKLLHYLFTGLVHSTGVRYGHLFLVNDRDNPTYSLTLTDDQLEEHDEPPIPPLHEQGLIGWAYRQRQGILVANTETDLRWTSRIESLKGSPQGSAVAVPIQTTSRVLGAIGLIADDPHHFDQTDLTLITDLVNQTAILLENSRLNTLATRTQKILAALRQSAHTINSAKNLEKILYAILDQLKQAIPHQDAVILLEKDQSLRVIAATTSFDDERHKDMVFTPQDTPGLFRALSHGQTIISQDSQALHRLRTSKPIHTWTAAPLTANDEALGILLLVSRDLQTFDDQEISTVNTFADHIATAIAHHRLAQETAQRLRELAFLHESGQAITSTLNLDRILQQLLERVRELLQIDAASIALRDEQTGGLIFEAASGEGAAEVLGIRLKPGQGIAGWVAETGKPLLVPDVYKDTRFFPDIDQQIGMKTQAILCVPILLKGVVVGVIEALNPGKVPFDERAINLLNALAGLAATAIDNARLFAQVRSAEARYEGLFEDSVNPIIITDLNGTIVDANRNACTLLDQTKASLRGTNLVQLRAFGNAQDLTQPLAQVRAGQNVTFQTTIMINGQQLTIEINGKQVAVKGTTLVQWIGRDVSAEIELEQMREDMLRMMIHDLRNPLANIMNSIDILKDVLLEKDSDTSQAELLTIARRSGQRLHRLINSILDISRLEAGQTILETQPTDLIPVLKEAVEFVRPQAEIREIQLSVRHPPRLPQVDIDQDMILRVILNLLDNAIKFNKVNGQVELEASVQQDKIKVSVQDDGPGIAPEYLPHIFEKFVRVRQHKVEGTGLGLAFCQLAVQAHGGEIWVKSTLDKGSTFTFVLPLPPDS